MPLLDDVTLIATKLGIPSQVAQQGGALSVLKSACAMLGFTPKPRSQTARDTAGVLACDGVS